MTAIAKPQTNTKKNDDDAPFISSRLQSFIQSLLLFSAVIYWGMAYERRVTTIELRIEKQSEEIKELKSLTKQLSDNQAKTIENQTKLIEILKAKGKAL